MGCNCGSKASRVEGIRTSRLPPTRSGGYNLSTYPDCTDLHLGQWQGTSVYVVGRATQFERLFRRVDLPSASAYAREVKQTIENLPTAGLCDQAVVDLYGTP